MNVGKDRRRQNHETRYSSFLKILNMRSTSCRKHEMRKLENLEEGIDIPTRKCNGHLERWDHCFQKHDMEIQ